MRLASFLLRSRGAVAPIMAISIFLLVLVSGGAVEYGNFYRAREALQRSADAAALSAARHYHENRDEAAAQVLIQNILENSETPSYKTQFPVEATFEYDEDHHSSRVALTVRATAPTAFMRLAGVESLTATVASDAMKGGLKDVYLYLLLDVTGSMGPLIQVAGLAMTDLEAQLRLKLESQGVDLGRLFVKAGYFRDLRVDRGTYGGWEESPLYDMSRPEQRTLLSGHIRSRSATGGGDTPESSPAAIAHALTTPMETPLGGGAPPSKHLVQVIALWTHVDGLPMGKEDIVPFKTAVGSDPMRRLSPEVDDITVSMYKQLSRSGSFPRISAGQEDAHVGAAYYGCCETLDRLRSEWHNRGQISLANRYLVLFVKPYEYPWKDMSRWENVLGMDYVDSSPEAFIDGIVEAVVESGVNLQITPPRR